MLVGFLDHIESEACKREELGRGVKQSRFAEYKSLRSSSAAPGLRFDEIGALSQPEQGGRPQSQKVLGIRHTYESSKSQTKASQEPDAKA